MYSDRVAPPVHRVPDIPPLTASRAFGRIASTHSAVAAPLRDAHGCFAPHAKCGGSRRPTCRLQRHRAPRSAATSSTEKVMSAPSLPLHGLRAIGKQRIARSRMTLPARAPIKDRLDHDRSQPQ
ncbi:hypothetical protein D2W70_26175 [Burkholderia pseudomallei]|nr:hypothetical protein D2W70_26175 [Burkholderia pseudomallei]RIV62190.1 hypothetical protein D2W49_13130 [Burkholderia pseudomallei]